MTEQTFTADESGWYQCFSAELPLKGTGKGVVEQLWDGDPRRGGRLVYERSRPQPGQTITLDVEDQAV